MNKKINLFIVGAAKSGTTSLWSYLKKHPDVFMPEDELHKEMCFFSSVKWYSERDYFGYFQQRVKDEKWIGDASTAYLTDPFSASQIYKYNPNARIIIILRNPAKRAYSLYSWMVQHGYEYISSFEKALEYESIRRKKVFPNYFEPGIRSDYLYYESGLYYDQVKRYIDLFGQNLRVYKFEDFKENSDLIYSNICSFLEIKKEDISFEKENASVYYSLPFKNFTSRKLSGAYWDSISRGVKTIPSLLKDIKRQWDILTWNIIIGKAKRNHNIEFRDYLKCKMEKNKYFRRIEQYGIREKFEDLNLRDELYKILIGESNVSKPMELNAYNNLMKSYQPDIESLSSLTNINFKIWLSENLK